VAKDEQPRSTVYLVGAGPGDPDLITVKGMDLLERCDVLLYDGLVAPELVNRCRAPEQIYVGKTSGGHSMRQEQIIELLLRYATKEGPPRKIVRLKGGDPFVFGRGGEEALALVAEGVPVEVVPGITSGVAASAYAGVPVTHRQVTSGVLFVTGHRAAGSDPDLPWEHLAGCGLTLVFYMGVSTLPIIARELMAHGLDGATPAMTIQEGTTPGQRQVSASVATLVDAVREAGIRPPAITVIGDVVELGQTLVRQQPRPLAGRTVVFVRAEEAHYEDVNTLRIAGARVLDVPAVRCVLRDDDDVRHMIEGIRSSDVVAFTSKVAVRLFGQLWRQAVEEERTGATPQFIAGSPVVVDAMALEGFPAEMAPQRMGAGQVIQTLRIGKVAAGRVWLPRAAAADDELPNALERAGYEPLPVNLYDTVPVPVPHDVRSILKEGRADAVMFLSGTCAASLVDAVPEIVADSACNKLQIAAVGRKTARIAESLGLDCSIVPDHPGVLPLVQAVARALQTR